MKTKILFFFLLLVVGMGNGFAENRSRDSLFQEIKNARDLVNNWDTISRSESDKLLAFIMGSPLQISDSIRQETERYLGVLIPKTCRYKRYVQYDKTNKSFKESLELSSKSNDIPRIILMVLFHILLIVCLVYLTELLLQTTTPCSLDHLDNGYRIFSPIFLLFWKFTYDKLFDLYLKR